MTKTGTGRMFSTSYGIDNLLYRKFEAPWFSKSFLNIEKAIKPLIDREIVVLEEYMNLRTEIGYSLIRFVTPLTNREVDRIMEDINSFLFRETDHPNASGAYQQIKIYEADAKPIKEEKPAESFDLSPLSSVLNTPTQPSTQNSYSQLYQAWLGTSGANTNAGGLPKP